MAKESREQKVDDDPDSSSISSCENDVFSFKESLIPLQEQKVAGTTEISLDGLLDPPLRLKEDLKEGCGGQLWPAGMLLSKYMLRYHRDDLASKSILEIGAGGGLVGLAIGRGCNLKPVLPASTLSPAIPPTKLYITDQLPMYALMLENIKLNDLSSTVNAAIYDWGTPLPATIISELQSRGKRKPDLILAADCVYFEPSFPLLKDTLLDLLQPEPMTKEDEGPEAENGGPVCYFAFKKRRKADWRFVKMISKVLEIEEIVIDDKGVVIWDEGAQTAGNNGNGHSSKAVGVGNREGVYLYRMTAKKSSHLRRSD